MYRSSQHRIDKEDSLYRYCSAICSASAMLYNRANFIIRQYSSAVEAMKSFKPLFPNQMQVFRMVNEILKELKYYFETSSAADYLHLAEEPREDDLEHHPGTTYGEMSLLLDAYDSVLTAFRLDRLYAKD